MQARIRFPAFVVAKVLHTAAAATAMSFDVERGTMAINIMCVVFIAAVVVYAAYSTEQREREALLVVYELKLARVAVQRSGV